MTERSWRAARHAVFERAEGCCEYCQTCEENTGQTMHVEHIDPAGGDRLDNLCLSCPACNLSKAAATIAVDPMSGETQRLFNPRTQRWDDHFQWADGGLQVLGKTASGRATITRLQMNHERVVRARRNWILAGTHPPRVR